MADSSYEKGLTELSKMKVTRVYFTVIPYAREDNLKVGERFFFYRHNIKLLYSHIL